MNLAIIDKWKNIFSLDKILINEQNVCLALEYASEFLLDDAENGGELEYTAVFLVLIRIFNKKDDISADLIKENVIIIVKDFSKIYYENNKNFKKINNILNVDSEAIFCKNYADNFKLKI